MKKNESLKKRVRGIAMVWDLHHQSRVWFVVFKYPSQLLF